MQSATLSTERRDGAPPARKEGSQRWIPFSDSLAERDIRTYVRLREAPGFSQGKLSHGSVLEFKMATSMQPRECELWREAEQSLQANFWHLISGRLA